MIRSDSFSSLTPRRHRRTPEEREAQEQIKRRNDELALLQDIDEMLTQAARILVFLGNSEFKDVAAVADSTYSRLIKATMHCKAQAKKLIGGGDETD